MDDISTGSGGFNGGMQHWAEGLAQCVLSLSPDSTQPFEALAGVEDCQFIEIGNIRREKLTYLRGDEQLVEGAILLQLGEHNVSGLTKSHVQQLLQQYCSKGGPLTIKTVKPGLLLCDLRQYLCMRFPKHSLDHDLQNTIRDNVYLKTVPYTTREKRPGEVDGVDYRFVSVDEFLELDKGGELLETGLYEGNYYGTPKPTDSSEIPTLSPNTTLRITNRRKTDLGDMAPLYASDQQPPMQQHVQQQMQQQMQSPMTNGHMSPAQPPLPPNWELAYHDGEPYFIDHNNGTTQWTDPRMNGVEVAEEDEDRLPPGWEKVDDPQYGTYFVDHINKHTQYEKPSLHPMPSTSTGTGHQSQPRTRPVPDPTPVPYPDQLRTRRVRSVPDMSRKYTRRRNGQELFTRNPSELQGELVTTTLVKGPGGVGFTLIGNDASSPVDEFLQIKSVIPNGPAYMDAKLRMGDVLVYINDSCVLGATQDDAIRLFKAVPVGGNVRLQVCRGYPLLFDNESEVITTNAYLPQQSMSNRDATLRSPQMMTVEIVKGDLGFGFTIADSAHGQKVKKILDKPRCRGLIEGDLLCDINGVNVRRMSHSDIVDVLRDCPVGQRAQILIQRNATEPAHAFVNGRMAPSIPIKPRVNQSHSVEQRPHSYHPGFDDTERSDRRSKTPTADFQYGYTNGNGYIAPSVKPRSRTPGAIPIPPRPTKPNGYIPQSQHYMNSIAGPSFTQGADAIYENLPKHDRSRSPGLAGRQKYLQQQHSQQSFAYATPNYVPASVYTQRFEQNGGSTAGSTQSASQYQFNDHHAVQFEKTTVNLIRQAQGFGFRVMGGSEANTPIRVGPVLQGGAAFLDGRLFEGDEITEIDNENVTGESHKLAIQLMQRASHNGHVKLVVRRPVTNAEMSRSLSMPARIVGQQPSKQYPYDVLVHRNDNEGFGFVIISAVNKNGSTIGRIIDGSPAYRCGQLNVNDRIIAVNGIDILNMHHGAIVNLIKDCGLTVTLTVGDPNESYFSGPPSTAGSNVAPTAVKGLPLERQGSLQSLVGAMTGGLDSYHENTEYSQINVSEPNTPEDRNTPVNVIYPRSSVLKQARASEEFFAVELERGSKGFGFSIRGGQEFGSMPLFVLRIADRGPAHMDGRVQVGDQLIEINGVSTAGMSHEQAIELIKSQPTVRLLIRRHQNEASVVDEGHYNTNTNPTNTMPSPALHLQQQDIASAWTRST